MAQHRLKTWPEPFLAVREGRKRHEVRKFDRDFRVGDELLLCEWDPKTGEYTGAFWTVFVTAITEPGQYGLPADVGVMSIRPYGEEWRTFG